MLYQGGYNSAISMIVMPRLHISPLLLCGSPLIASGFSKRELVKQNFRQKQGKNYKREGRIPGAIQNGVPMKVLCTVLEFVLADTKREKSS